MSLSVANTTLKLASPEQALAINTEAYIQYFGKGLNLEQWLAIDEKFGKMERARDGRFRLWSVVLSITRLIEYSSC
jgi:hypothetical protein